MPPQSKIDQLPEHVRLAIEKALIAANFSDYEAIAEHFREKGHDISKSAMHRYGQKLDQRMAMIRASTDAAKMIARNVEDDENHLSEAVLSLIHSELFETMLQLQAAQDMAPGDIDGRMKTLSSAAKSISEVVRASVHNKKYQEEVRQRTALAADKVEAIAKKGGLSAETSAEIRREILGIAVQ